MNATVIDCPDPMALATFYGRLLGQSVTQTDADWVIVGPAGQGGLAFQLAPDLQPPSWPDANRPQQLHLDIKVNDIKIAEPEVLALGAVRLAADDDQAFRVYADPAGHPFCLVW